MFEKKKLQPGRGKINKMVKGITNHFKSKSYLSKMDISKKTTTKNKNKNKKKTVTCGKKILLSEFGSNVDRICVN